MTYFWLSAWTISLSLTWLIPNHSYPWVGFHADTLMALVCMLGATWLTFKTRGHEEIRLLNILPALLILLIWVQHGLGLLPLRGNAWISSAYLLGFVMALSTGAKWEKNHPGQLLNALFMAILIASVLSVGIQLKQWLQVDGLWLWLRSDGSNRPSANLAQPNQLGTLLLCGVLSSVWALEKKYINAPIAAILAIFLLFGVALTSSRTAWLGLTWMILAAWVWRRHLVHQWLPFYAVVMGIYFALCVNLVNLINASDLFVSNKSYLDFSAELIAQRFSNEARLTAWVMFVDAIKLQPWFGYGFNQTAVAHTAVAIDHPMLGVNFTFAHNLLIDLILWCGIPIGLLVISGIFFWLWQRARRINSNDMLIAVLTLVVIGNHAMFEMPLYYAYFLLPFGLIAGAIDSKIGGPPLFTAPVWLTPSIWLAGCVLLGLVIRDFSRVEPSYENLMFERQNIQVKRLPPPEVLLLNQWHDYIEMAQFLPKAGLHPEKLLKMRQIASLYPSSFNSYTMAATLALNQQPQEARMWLLRLCKMSPEQNCLAFQRLWRRQSLEHSEIAAIPWPDVKGSMAVKLN